MNIKSNRTLISLFICCFSINVQAQSITWTDLVGVEVEADNSLIKTAGWGTDNGGAASEEVLAENTDGWAEFTAYATGHQRFFGLSENNIDATDSIDYVIKLTSTNQVIVHEYGFWKASVATS